MCGVFGCGLGWRLAGGLRCYCTWFGIVVVGGRRTEFAFGVFSRSTALALFTYLLCLAETPSSPPACYD